MNLFYQASETNCSGAFMLASGQDRDALQAFNGALASVQEFLATYNFDVHGDTSAARNEAVTKSAPKEYLQEEVMSSPQADSPRSLVANKNPNKFSEVPIPGLVDAEMHIFNKAIIFYRMPNDNKNCSSDEVKLLSCAIMFNIALCFQKRGKITSKTSLLRRACRIYERCHQTMPRLIAEQSMHIVLLAAMNNQAQICYELQDNKYKKLSMQIANLVQQSSHLRNLDLNDMLLNIVMWRNLSRKAACAA